MESLITGKDKAKLQKRLDGVGIRFVKKVEELGIYECVSCKHLALYNYTPACQHLYCSKCHGKVSGKICVMTGCSKPIGEDTEEKLMDKDIANLEVFCAYNNAGCLQKIALHNYLKHIENCKYSHRNLLPKVYKENPLEVFKEKTNEEISKLKEENSALHLKIRQIETQLSDQQHDKGIFEEVGKLSQTLKTMSAERDTLRNEIIKLVDGKVEDIIERQAVKRNLQEQKMEKMESNMKEEMSKIQEKHAKSEETIMQLVSQTISTQIKKQDIEEAASTSFDWRISGIRQILKDWKDGIMREVLGDAFNTKDFGYAMRCKLVYRAKQKSFSILFHFDPNIPKSAPAIYHHQRSFAILDQSRFGEKHIWRLDTPGFGGSQAKEWMTGYHNDSWTIPLEVLGAKSPYILNDVIVARILIEPMAMVYKSVFSKNGTLIWKLDSYSQRKQDYIDGVTKFLRSPCFYTHEQGYRVHLGLHARSHDMSFYLSFNKGEFDDYLPSTFPHHATLVIMPQLGHHEHESLIHSQKSSDTTSNLIAMIPTKVIESPEYLQDDSILIKLTVE